MNNFDWIYYIKLYTDLNYINNENDALNHYYNHGKNEARICNNYLYTKFEWNFYISIYEDLKNLNREEAFLHFINNGRFENRICIEDVYYNFNWEFYVYLYDDIKIYTTKKEALFHYFTYGIIENRIYNKNNIKNFNWKFYINYNDDLKGMNINNELEAIKHWIYHGSKENRICNNNLLKDFNWEFYLYYNEDLKLMNINNEKEAIKHWYENGSKENRICNNNLLKDFDWKFYLSYYNDLSNISTELDAYKHYISNGLKENRKINDKNINIFDIEFYLKLYPDIENNITAIYDHWKNNSKSHVIVPFIKDNTNIDKNINKSIVIICDNINFNDIFDKFEKEYNNFEIIILNNNINDNLNYNFIYKYPFPIKYANIYNLNKINLYEYCLKYSSCEIIIIKNLIYNDLYSYDLDSYFNINEDMLINNFYIKYEHDENLKEFVIKNEFDKIDYLNNELSYNEEATNEKESNEEENNEEANNEEVTNEEANNEEASNEDAINEDASNEDAINEEESNKENSNEEENNEFILNNKISNIIIISKNNLNNFLNNINYANNLPDIIKNNIINNNIIKYDSLQLIDNLISKEDNNFITFIIPSIGRESLLDSINSLKNMNDPNWKAIILFDGVKNNFNIKDNRITIIEIDKKEGILNEFNSAGLVRNIGMKNATNTEWIAFLDDDDYLSPDYIDNLKIEIKLNESIEVCVFRMTDINNLILPTNYDNTFNKNRVGISFAMKKYVGDQVLFKNDRFEDYYFLKELEFRKYNIIISPFVNYFIRTNPYPCKLYKRQLINF